MIMLCRLYVSTARTRLKRPSGITFDGTGNLFVADSLNHRIRVVYGVAPPR